MTILIAHNTYYACTTGSQCGQLQTITNAAGQVTTFNTYNVSGQPLMITDPNGFVATADVRCPWKDHIQCYWRGEDTIAYYPTGLPKQVTLADGSYLQYTYNGAHQLTAISDAIGNVDQFVVDVMGNRVRETAFGPIRCWPVVTSRDKWYVASRAIFGGQVEESEAGSEGFVPCKSWDSAG